MANNAFGISFTFGELESIEVFPSFSVFVKKKQVVLGWLKWGVEVQIG